MEESGLGDDLTMWTARGFVVLYLIAEGLRWVRQSREARQWEVAVQWGGFVALTLHILAAFQFTHYWSHAEAYRHTAEQTAAITGWSWGGGVYVNYGFWIILLVDTVARTWHRRNEGELPYWYDWGVRAFFAFIVFNATVVFGTPAWIPVLIGYLGLLVCVKGRRQRRVRRP